MKLVCLECGNEYQETKDKQAYSTCGDIKTKKYLISGQDYLEMCVSDVVPKNLENTLRKLISLNLKTEQIEFDPLNQSDIVAILNTLGISQQELSQNLLCGLISRETITRFISGSKSVISDKNMILMMMLLRERLPNVRVKKKYKSIYYV